MATRANWQTLKRIPVRKGVDRRVFAGRNSMMVLNTLAPGAPPNLHRHQHEQLTYIIEGTCRFVLGGETLEMTAGDLVLVPPDIPHSLEVTGEVPVLNMDIFSPVREDYLP